MPFHPPSIPPIVVHWLVQEKLFYEEWDFWVSVGTLLLAAATVWLAFETRGLRKDSIKSIQASERTATAAAETAKVAAEMARHRRAWITIRTHKRERHPTLRIPVHARVWFINSGETPAFEIEISHKYLVQENSTDVHEGTFDWEDPLVAQRLPLGPGLEIDQFDEFRYQTNQEKQLLEDDRSVLFWYGIVAYKDIFGEARWTKWCYQYDVTSQDFLPAYFHNDVS